jgi:hypothetical protein
MMIEGLYSSHSRCSKDCASIRRDASKRANLLGFVHYVNGMLPTPLYQASGRA